VTGVLRAFTLSLVAVILLAGVGQARAASDLGDIIVSVVDGQGGPVSGAAVFLLGTTIDGNRTGVTSADGTFGAELLRPGTYRLVVRAKNREPVTTSADVRPEQTVHVRVVLAEALHVIGRVRSTSSPATMTVDAKAPSVRLSRSFLDAVAELSGVNVTYDPRGEPTGLSIRGRDPSQTRYSFNGAEIVDPLRSHLVDPDLLQSARIDDNLDMVGFTTLAPTSQPTYSFTETVGGQAQFVERGTLQGTIGTIGVAAAALRRNVRSSLDGAVYEDTSGATYLHRGDYASTSAYLSAATNLGQFWRATVSEVGSNSASHPLATYFAGPLPYGYGGSVSGASRAYTTILNLSGSLPAALVGVSISAGSGSTADDERNRVLFGLADPEYDASRFHFSSFDVDLTAPRTNSPHFRSSGLREATLLTIGPSGGSASSVFRTYERGSASFGETFRTSPAATLAIDVGVAEGTNAPVAPAGTASFSVRGRSGSASARYSVGAESPPDLGSASFSRVGDASYDCAGNSIHVYGPSDPVGAVRSRKIALDASRGDDERSLSLSLYDESYRGSGLADALVPATLQPVGYFPPGYLDAIANGWATAGGCSGSFADRSRIFVHQGISGLRVAYRGISARGRTRVGRFTLEGFIDLTGATLKDDSGRLASPVSVYVPDRQLPGVPRSKLGVTIGWIGRDGKTQLLLNGTQTGSNNANRLPTYVLVTAGLERSLSAASSIDFVLTNVSGSYVGDFTSSRYAVPLTTRGGEALSLIAAPLRAPALYVRFRTNLAH
jgi:hypothetical protein